MSQSIDVNVLLYASDSSSPFHKKAKALLKLLLKDQLYLTYPVLMSYLRIVTNPRVLSQPLTGSEALENILALVGSSRVRLLSEESGFFEVYAKMTRDIPVHGNLVPDAHLTALLTQHGVKRLYTNDSDFRRFSSIEVINPFLD